MEETAAQTYSWIQMGAVALVALLAVVGLIAQTRRRPYSVVALALRAVFAVVTFVVLLVMSGVGIAWLWGAVAALVGAALGFVSGKTSKVTTGEQGRPVIKKAPWPALVSAIAYVVAMAALVYGTAGLFSVSLLLVLFATMMTVGATVAEITRGGAGTSSPDAASATAAAPDRS